MDNNSLVWCIAGVATLGVILRPFRWPEFIWAVLGAAVARGIGAAAVARRARRRRRHRCLFLPRRHDAAVRSRARGRLFDCLARCGPVGAAREAALPHRLCRRHVVTVFMSNDATAVVLTPAVRAARRGQGPRCPIFSSAPSSPTPRASCCRSRTRRTSCSLAITCRRCRCGSRALPCPRFSRSWRRSSRCASPRSGA